MAGRGYPGNQVTLRITRAEIGSHLNITLETVSRAVSKLAAENVIVFNHPGRREITIPDLPSLEAYVLKAAELDARLDDANAPGIDPA